jgi:hypothetical protein
MYDCLFGRLESLLHAEHHVDPLHDEVLVGVVGLVFGRNFKHRGNHLVVVPQNVADVIRNLHTYIYIYTLINLIQSHTYIKIYDAGRILINIYTILILITSMNSTYVYKRVFRQHQYIKIDQN